MTEHKFTDEEVIKALEVCVDNSSCKECPINPNHGNYGYCTNLALTYALDLIKRQKAEIAYWMDEAVNAKKEAVKEFAEKLKKEAGYFGRAIAVEDVERIAKEMIGEEK